MVKGLSDAGLRTVMDVVYNHTASAGMNDKSVFDRIVPGYYQRRDIVSGAVTNKQCCNDMGTEWKMGEKLMFDTALRWVTEYKVDGFRFDIMAAHTLDQMQRLLAATRAINPAFYIYGEGWNTGGGQDDKRYVSARQDNLAGTGIGSFNDRMRDGVRGGGCCDSGATLVNAQGITSGLWYDPNSANSGCRVGKDGVARQGRPHPRASWPAASSRTPSRTRRAPSVAGSTLGSYVADPSELINYVEVHDNMTFWDLSQFKQPAGTPTVGPRACAERRHVVRAAGGRRALPARGPGNPALEVDGHELVQLRRLVQRSRLDPRDGASGRSACRRRVTTRAARPRRSRRWAIRRPRPSSPTASSPST